MSENAQDVQAQPQATPDQSAQQPDQSQAQPQTPNYPPSPDQGGPIPQTQAAQPAPTGSKWSNVVKGALDGLLMGGGVGAVKGALAPTATRQAFQNKQDQQTARTQQAQANVRFTDAQSAYNAQLTNMEALKVEHMPQEYQAESNKNVQSLVQFNQEHLGIQYDAIPNSPQALQDYLESQPNGAQMGRALVSPSMIYIPKAAASGDSNSDPMAQYANAAKLAQALGIPIAAKTDYIRMNPQQRLKALSPIVNMANGHDANGGILTGDKLPNIIADRESKIEAYQKSDGADPKIVDQLQTSLSQMKNDLDAQHKEQDLKSNRATKQGIQIANARGASIANSKIVETTGDNGTPTYGRAGDLVGKPTGKASAQLQPLEKTAEDAEKSYQMFQQAYSDYKSGTATGAQSMLALSQHLATTFGVVKGARVTKDMIQEHLGARSVSDSMLVAAQKLVNGDALSPQQWDAFRELIGQSRKYSWGTYVTKANAMGVNVRGNVPKDLGGSRDISNTQSTAPTAGGKQQPSRPPLSSFEAK